VAALRSATGEHGPPIFGLHALAEAMSFGALPIIGLKRTFWHCFLNPERREQASTAKRYLREYKTLIIKGTDGKCKLKSYPVVGYFEIQSSPLPVIQ
jgi:hypothetical protein